MSLDVGLRKEKDLECECCGRYYNHFYTDNITHNLNTMADKAGIYMALWRPEEIGIKQAKGLIKILKQGIVDLENYPQYYRKFNPENKWGDYDTLLKFVKNYLKECEENPESYIYVSR